MNNSIQGKAALEIGALTVRSDTHVVISDVSFVLKQGVMLAVIGPNGAGKTTLLKSIVGLVKPTSGSIYVLGKSVSEMLSEIAYVPQRTSVDWDFPITVLEVVLMGCYQQLGWFSLPGKEHRARAYEILELLGMKNCADRSISSLSGGQQQRVFVARALMQNAAIYILDEPFAGIDMQTEKVLASVFKSLCAQGKTVIVVHHDLHTIADYFEYVLLLNIKKIAYGPVQDVLKPHLVSKAYGSHSFLGSAYRKVSSHDLHI